MNNSLYGLCGNNIYKPEVLEEMLPYFTELYGNPSSIYSISRETKKAIDKARNRVAKALNAIQKKYISLVVDQKQITGQLKE